jgi:hypothetical protein
MKHATLRGLSCVHTDEDTMSPARVTMLRQSRDRRRAPTEPAGAPSRRGQAATAGAVGCAPNVPLFPNQP